MRRDPTVARVRLPHPGLFAAALMMAGGLRAESAEDRVAALFRAPLGEMIALSPDGVRVAYTAHDGGKPTLVIRQIEPPGRQWRLRLGQEANTTSTAAAEQPPIRLRFLRWATPTRLVFAPAERVIPLPPVADETGRLVPNPDGPTIVSPIQVVDTESEQHGTLVDARDFMETPADARRSLADLLRTPTELAATRNGPVHWRMPHLEILGFLPSDREQLILQTHGAYSMPMQHLVDLRTGHVREFGGETSAPPRDPQVFDWHRLNVVGERKLAAQPTTAWQDAELAGLQRDLEQRFPRRIVEILDWSETRQRVLFRVTGGSDPGRVFVYQGTEGLFVEILRRMPWLATAQLHPTRFFEIDAQDGARLSGYVTWPNAPRHTPPPLAVFFPSGFPGNAQPAFDPEAQLLADWGFVVLRLNHRSVAGVRPEDVGPLRTAIDRVALNDAVTMMEWLAAENAGRPFDRARIVALGRGWGGTFALRAAQLEPTRFRAAVAIDAPLEWCPTAPIGGLPAPILDHLADPRGSSVLAQADSLTTPVLLLVEPGRHAGIDAATAELRTRLQQLGRTADYAEIGPAPGATAAATRAEVYRKIESFLRAQLELAGDARGVAEEQR